MIERVLAEDGLADRLLADGGLIETLTARNGPLEQLAAVADTLNRLAPGLEALAPTIETPRGGRHPESGRQSAQQHRRPHSDPRLEAARHGQDRHDGSGPESGDDGTSTDRIVCTRSADSPRPMPP